MTTTSNAIDTNSYNAIDTNSSNVLGPVAPGFALLNTAPLAAPTEQVTTLTVPEQAPTVFEVLSGVSAASAALESTATEKEAPKPRRKLTVEEKIAALEARILADTAKVAELRENGDPDARLVGVVAGSVVVVKLGRKFSEEKDTTRYVQAVVVAIKDDEDTKLYKVQFGEGWDAEVAVVRGCSITEVVSIAAE